MPPDKTAPKQRGFQKSQSGNPAGRPQGSRTKSTLFAEAILENDREGIMDAVVNAAKNGDPTAMRRRMRPDGAEYGGQKLSRGALYLILQNRLYRGEIPHKGHSYPGEHPPIVDKLLWDDVQAVLAANRVERTTGARASNPSLLTGMVFDETGERLTPTHAVKKGTRYRYYVSTSLITGAGRTRSSGRRIPAGNLEALVINRLRTFLADPGAILDAVDNESHNGSGCSHQRAAAANPAALPLAR